MSSLDMDKAWAMLMSRSTHTRLTGRLDLLSLVFSRLKQQAINSGNYWLPTRRRATSSSTHRPTGDATSRNPWFQQVLMSMLPNASPVSFPSISYFAHGSHCSLDACMFRPAAPTPLQAMSPNDRRGHPRSRAHSARHHGSDRGAQNPRAGTSSRRAHASQLR